MEVVLDVNVLVSAVLSGAGPPAELVAAMRDDRLSVVACPALLAELAGVLRRNRFRRYLSLDEVDEYVGEIEAMCRIVDDPDAVPAVLRDPDDDYLVALASESGAEVIVSGDLDLREATGLPVEILTPGRPSTASPADALSGRGQAAGGRETAGDAMETVMGRVGYTSQMSRRSTRLRWTAWMKASAPAGRSRRLGSGLASPSARVAAHA